MRQGREMCSPLQILIPQNPKLSSKKYVAMPMPMVSMELLFSKKHFKKSRNVDVPTTNDIASASSTFLVCLTHVLKSHVCIIGISKGLIEVFLYPFPSYLGPSVWISSPVIQEVGFFIWVKVVSDPDGTSCNWYESPGFLLGGSTL